MSKKESKVQDLTPELIEKLIQDGKWADKESLKEWAKKGAKWNTQKNSLSLTF